MINPRSSIDVFPEANKQTRGRTKNYDCFRCGSSYHRHDQENTPNSCGYWTKLEDDAVNSQAKQPESLQMLQKIKESLK